MPPEVKRWWILSKCAPINTLTPAAAPDHMSLQKFFVHVTRVLAPVELIQIQVICFTNVLNMPVREDGWKNDRPKSVRPEG